MFFFFFKLLSLYELQERHLLLSHDVFNSIGVIVPYQFKDNVQVLILVELLDARIQWLFKVTIEDIFHLKVHHDCPCYIYFLATADVIFNSFT
jgi:hypothetical protein